MKPVLVQEHYEGAHNGWMDITNLPLAQKVALWLLAGTFGVHGFNAGAFLDVNFSRSVIVDFEMSRGLFGLSQGPLPIGAGSFHPWVAENYLNEAQDYRLALKSWRETFAKPETKAELVRLMRRAAIPERRIAEDLKTFESNLSILDQSLERDIATGNRDFMDAAKRAGLDERQTTSLSFVNKAAHMSPQGGIFRDLVRLLNRRVSRGTLESKGFALKPEEWRQLLSSRPQGLTEADREAVLGWAEGGTLSPPRGGAAYTTAAARSALKHLGSLLKP
ncbi:MAG: hypothetical protein HY077_06990 [Elusimicrobia bacterium]|nr:hypothetical protein [Elusimicrobiota bacterium]